MLADRRFAWGQAAAADGDHAVAAELFVQALALAEHWPAGWFALGDALARSNDRDGAIAAFRRVVALDPDDALGASMALAALAAGATPANAGARHVTRLFDDYADRFDAHLTHDLHYRAPALLVAALSRAAPGRRWRRTFDLGCGTGLMGMAIRGDTAWLGGVDLSAAMLAKARTRDIYDALDVGDMIAALQATPAPSDLVLAADVLVYIGDLAPVFEAVAMASTADALFAFTLQRGEDGSGVTVGADRRFAHARDHVFARAAQSGFAVILAEAASTRRDREQDVPGLVVVLARSQEGFVMAVTPHDVIAFWTDAGHERWYKADPAFDEEIRARFLAAHESAVRGDLGWPDDAPAALATLLLLDQFSRNMFRGSPRAFATDALALSVTGKAIARGFDKTFEAPLRGFFYLPFTHAEDIAAQRRGEALYTADGDAEGLKWAVIHREIIEKFGRFPHRNAILERTTTAEEQAFLDADGFAG